MYTYYAFGSNYEVEVKKSQYANGRVALQLVDKEGISFAKATVNIPDFMLDEGEVIVKDYGENEGMLKFLQENKIVGSVLGYVSNGYCNHPLVKLLI